MYPETRRPSFVRDEQYLKVTYVHLFSLPTTHATKVRERLPQSDLLFDYLELPCVPTCIAACQVLLSCIVSVRI